MGGAGAEPARHAAETLLKEGAERLLVWGTAGALEPDLRPGALVIPDEVTDSDGGRYPLSGEWQARLRLGAPSSVGVSTGALITVAAPVPDRHAKTALAQHADAVAADMETAVVARLAYERGVPFAALRAIVDPLEQALPLVVLHAGSGRCLALEVALRLVGRPRDLPEVIALGRNMRAARRSLFLAARGLTGTPAQGVNTP